MARVSYASRLLDMVPPWLSRENGTRVLGGIGDSIDVHAARLIDSVQLRFPRATEPTALPYIGRDRRIRRGPAEPASSYARRMLTWWDDHRTRGGPFALLRQLHAYLVDFAPGPIDLIYQMGTRFQSDADTGAISRLPAIADWDGDGDVEKWARFLLVLRSPSPWVNVPLLTEGGEPLLNEEGEELLATVAIDSIDDETWIAVPREWSAAHIQRIRMAILYGAGELWDFPGPSDADDWTWGAWEDPTKTVDEDTPVMITIED